jgi:hypothetical protein
MLAWFSAYYNTFPERERVDVDELVSLVRLRAGSATQEQIALTLHLCDQLRTPIEASSLQGIISSLYELDLSGKAGALIARYNNSEEIDLAYELSTLSAEARRAMVDGTKSAWADRPILEYLEDDNDEGGLQWNSFPQLALNLKGLRKGDNVALCAPTDQGKTSLLCRLMVDFQVQAQHIYPGRPALYLVNEGTQERITARMYQTAVQLQRDDLLVLAREGTLEQRYAGIIGGRDMIRVANIHGKSMAQVANIIERHSPHLVVSDMTGRIRATSNRGGGANDIGQLEEVWNGFRELAVLQDFAHMGTVQVSAEGFNMLYPPLSALQNSKTGIQTTLDLVLMMGALTNPDAATLRGISTPKNKLGRSGKLSQNMFQSYFDAPINRWDTGT